MSNTLQPRHAKFVKNLTNGYNKQDSAILAGYSPRSASMYANQLLKKTKIREALDKAGLTDLKLAKTLNNTIQAGIGVKATNSDSIAGLRLAYELSGGLTKDNPENMTQNNIYINELKMLSIEELQAKLDQTLKEIASLKK